MTGPDNPWVSRQGWPFWYPQCREALWVGTISRGLQRIRRRVSPRIVMQVQKCPFLQSPGSLAEWFSGFHDLRKENKGSYWDCILFRLIRYFKNMFCLLIDKQWPVPQKPPLASLARDATIVTVAWLYISNIWEVSRALLLASSWIMRNASIRRRGSPRFIVAEVASCRGKGSFQISIRRWCRWIFCVVIIFSCFPP